MNNEKACYENPFVYGLLNTPINTTGWWENDDDYDDYEDKIVAEAAEAFKFIWSQLGDEDDACDCEARVFDEYVRNNHRYGQSYGWETDFQYPAQTLADLFSYSEGEAFYI